MRPGQLLAGEHPFGADPVDAQNRLASLRKAGIDYFIDLTEAGEMPNYRRLLAKWAAYVRFPIADSAVPRAANMQAIQARIRDSLARGRTLFVHCRAGIGRTGITVGCYLVEQGLPGPAALDELNRLWLQSARAASWPRIPQTQEQADYIVEWQNERGSRAP